MENTTFSSLAGFEIFDSFLDAVLITDQVGLIKYVNPSAAVLFHSSIVRLVDKQSLNSIIHFEPLLKLNSNFLAVGGDTSQPYREYTYKTTNSGTGIVNMTTRKLVIDGQVYHLVIMRDVTLEKTLHEKYQSELKEKIKILDQEMEQRIQLQLLNTELDRKIFHMSCLLDFNQKTRLLSDSNHLLNEFIEFVVGRFQFSGGFALQKNPVTGHSEIQFINGMAGRKVIFDKMDKLMIRLNALNLAEIPADLRITSNIEPDWREFINELNDNHQERMMSVKLKSDTGNTLIVFTLPQEQRGPGEHDLTLIKNLAQQTEVMIENTELKFLSLTDEMTKLYNQRYLKVSLNHEIQKSLNGQSPLSILLFDIDHFKKFNDTHGHQIGDLVLREVADKLKLLCRLTDIPFRYGGEEFVMLLPHTAPDQAIVVAERIRKGIEDLTIVKDGITLKVTISVGVSTCPNDGIEGEKLIKSADLALYAAKRAGRNNVQVFTKELLP